MKQNETFLKHATDVTIVSETISWIIRDRSCIVKKEFSQVNLCKQGTDIKIVNGKNVKGNALKETKL